MKRRLREVRKIRLHEHCTAQLTGVMCLVRFSPVVATMEYATNFEGIAIMLVFLLWAVIRAFSRETMVAVMVEDILHPPPPTRATSPVRSRSPSDADCGHCTSPTSSVQYSDPGCDDLNGSHGEWTGSDDVVESGCETVRINGMPPTSKVGDRIKATSGIDSGLQQLPEPSTFVVVDLPVLEDCRHWVNGKCTRHRCRYAHDPAKKFSGGPTTGSASPPIRASDDATCAEINVDDVEVVKLGVKTRNNHPVAPLFLKAACISTLWSLCVSALSPLPSYRRHPDWFYDSILSTIYRQFLWYDDNKVVLLFATWSLAFTLTYLFLRRYSRIFGRSEAVHTLALGVPRYVANGLFPWLVSSVSPDRARDTLSLRGLDNDVEATVNTGLVTFLLKRYRRSNIEAHLPNSWYKSIENYMDVLSLEIVNNSVRRAHQILYSQHLQDVEMGLYSGRSAVPSGRPN